MPNKYLDSVGLAEYTTLIKTALDDKADLASPALTGTPTAPTPTAGDDSTKVATTAFVQNAIDAEETRADGAYLPLTGGSVTGNLTVSGTITGNVTGTASGNLPLSGGTMTGTIKRSGVAVVNTEDNTYTQYQGGTDETSSYICVYGKNHSSNPGVINLRAYDGTNSHYLKLNPNGIMTWGGNDISPQNADETQSSADTSLPSGTQKTVHSFTLTKGTWLVLGRVYFPTNANGYRTGWFSSSNNGSAVSSQARCTAVPPSGAACWIQVMSILSVSSSTTYYLVASQSSGSTLNSSGGVVKFRLSSIV